MLAPLKDRSVLERDDEVGAPTELAAENAMLRQALKQGRKAQKRAATLAAARIAGLERDQCSLAEANRQLQARLAQLESGQAVTALGQQLLALRTQNEELTDGLRQMWALDRNLCAAHRECERLARERDSALACLAAGCRRLSDEVDNPSASGGPGRPG